MRRLSVASVAGDIILRSEGHEVKVAWKGTIGTLYRWVADLFPKALSL